MMEVFCYPAIYIKEDNEQYSLQFVDLAEAYTCAESEKKLWKNANEVLTMTLEYRLFRNSPLPEPTSMKDIKLKENENVCIITAEIFEPTDLVEIAIKVPNHLRYFIETNKLDAGMILTKALIEEYEQEINEQSKV